MSSTAASLLGCLLLATLVACGAPAPVAGPRGTAVGVAARADAPWGSQPTDPLPRSGSTGAVLQGRLHVVGGVPARGLATNTVEILAAGDGWLKAPALPLATQQAAAAAGPDGHLYVVGGKDAEGLVRGVAHRYDPALEAWEPLPPLVQARADAFATADEEFVYVVGGWNGKPSGEVEALQLSTLTWRTLKPLPTPRAGVVAHVVDGRLLVAGGHTKAGPSDRLEIFDLQQREWLPGVPLPTARTQAAAVVWSHELYVLGGRDARGPVATVERYNPALNAWTRLPDLPEAVVDPVAGVVWQPGVGETLVVTGGSVGGQASGRTWGWAMRRPGPVGQGAG